MINLNKKRNLFRIITPSYPLFNIYSVISDKTTALGPVCIATAVNKMEDWDAEVIDENNLKRYGPRDKDGLADHNVIQSQRPADVVGFYGGLTSTITRLYDVAKFYKQKGVITIAGGQHFVDENIEEALNSNIDYLVLGEGEETIKELLRALKLKTDISKIKGLAYLKDNKVFFTETREPITDFEFLPPPNFSLVRYANIQIFPVCRIRGCGMDCEFCTVKGKPRPAAPEHFLEDIRYLLETYGAYRFFFVDDLFGQHREETIRFCKMLKDYQQSVGKRLDIVVQIRLDKAKDKELLTVMREAGINMVAIGFESPIEEELKVMKKKIKPEEMIELAREYHRFGFLVHGMFIFGYPMKEGSSFSMPIDERIKIYRRFIRKAKIDTVQVLLPVPLPGTELRERLKKQNRIYPKSDIGWEYYDGNFPLFEPDKPLTPEDMQKAICKIMGKFYQFKYMLLVVWHIFYFPTLIFYLHNLKEGWLTWYRQWRNSILRFGGWMIIKGWMTEFKKGLFTNKLKTAQSHLKK